MCITICCAYTHEILAQDPEFSTNGSTLQHSQETQNELTTRETFTHLHETLFDVYMPTSSVVSNAYCRNHSELYKDGVERKQSWAMKMLDSSSKWSAGMLTGNIVQLGFYDECVKLDGIPSDSFRGQHCMISFSTNTVPGEKKNASMHPIINSIRLSDHKYENHTWSMCVPSTCPSDDIGRHFVSSVMHAVSSPGNVSVSVNKVTCQTQEPSPEMTTADYYAISFFLFIFVLLTASTIYDLVTYYSEHRLSILTAFSVYSNGRVLLTPATDMMPALHGVRVMTRIWDEVGQYYTRPNLTPALNAEVLDEFATDKQHVFITHYSNSSDTIFLLSGLLVAFNFMKERQMGVKFYLILFYVKRYIRFTPPFATMILLSATVFRFLGDGPFWAERTETMRANCNKTWWLGILYVNNYIYPESQCLPQQWFNCAEMQLVWLCPLVLVPLWKWPRLGKTILVFLIVAGCGITFAVAYVYEVPVNRMDGSGENKQVYWPTHTRYNAWLIGLGVGYLLQEADLRLPHHSAVAVRCGWAVSIVLLLAPSAIGGYFVQPGYKYRAYVAATYISLMRPAFTVGVGWVVYACVTGHGGFVNSFLSCAAFRVVSRSMYSFYLSHVSVRLLVSAAVRTPMFIDDTTVTLKFAGGAILAYVVSILLCLIFEMPYVIMEQHFLGKIGHKDQAKPRSSATSLASILRPPEEGGPSTTRQRRDTKMSLANMPRAEKSFEVKEETGVEKTPAAAGVRFVGRPSIASASIHVPTASSSIRAARQDINRMSAELVMSDTSVRSVQMRPEPSVVDVSRSTAELVGMSGAMGSSLLYLANSKGNILPHETSGEFRSRLQLAKQQRSQEDRLRGTTELDMWEDEEGNEKFQERVNSRRRLHSTLNLKQLVDENARRQSADVEIIGNEYHDMMIKRRMIMDIEPRHFQNDNIFDFPSSSRRRDSILEPWLEESAEEVATRTVSAESQSLSRHQAELGTDQSDGWKTPWWFWPFARNKDNSPTVRNVADESNKGVVQDVDQQKKDGVQNVNERRRRGLHWPIGRLKKHEKKVTIGTKDPKIQKEEQPVDTAVAGTSKSSEKKENSQDEENKEKETKKSKKDKNAKGS